MLRPLFFFMFLLSSGFGQTLSSELKIGPPAKANLVTAVTPEAGLPDTQILINLESQRLQLSRAGQIMLDTAISTGKPGFRTPRGHYAITDKQVDKISTIYHVPMPYFMRLDELPIGIHFGHNPGEPASHGCIRVGSRQAAQALFKLTLSGTRVVIEQ